MMTFNCVKSVSEVDGEHENHKTYYFSQIEVFTVFCNKWITVMLNHFPSLIIFRKNFLHKICGHIVLIPTIIEARGKNPGMFSLLLSFYNSTDTWITGGLLLLLFGGFLACLTSDLNVIYFNDFTLI